MERNEFITEIDRIEGSIVSSGVGGSKVIFRFLSWEEGLIVCVTNQYGTYWKRNRWVRGEK